MKTLEKIIPVDKLKIIVFICCILLLAMNSLKQDREMVAAC